MTLFAACNICKPRLWRRKRSVLKYCGNVPPRNCNPPGSCQGGGGWEPAKSSVCRCHWPILYQSFQLKNSQGGVYAPARGHGAPPLSDLQAHSPHVVRPLPRLPPRWRNWRSWLSSPRDLLRDVWPLSQKRRDGRGICSFPARPGICCWRCSISLIVTFYSSCLPLLEVGLPFRPFYSSIWPHPLYPPDRSLVLDTVTLPSCHVAPLSPRRVGCNQLPPVVG